MRAAIGSMDPYRKDPPPIILGLRIEVEGIEV
jgi:hypothetical protein